MKKFFFLLIVIFFSCNENEDYYKKYEEKASVLYHILKNKTDTTFNNISIEARCIRNGKYIVYNFYFVKDTFGLVDSYKIPNFNYYDKEECLNNSDVIDFAKLYNITNQDSAYIFVKNFSEKIISRYEFLNISSIYNSPYSPVTHYILDNKYTLYHITDSNLLNFSMKKEIENFHRIDENWYFGKTLKLYQ